eukprot:snap_masked-scaffold_7-processed-gene-15.32-mRNA-1 protein AED:1.00 eAED:1.00 QI:0/0/0/0/1/1/2/0/96
MFRSEVTPDHLKMNKYIGTSDILIAVVGVVPHRTNFTKNLLKHDLRRTRQELRDSEDTDLPCLIKVNYNCLSKGGGLEFYYSNKSEAKPRLKGLKS